MIGKKGLANGTLLVNSDWISLKHLLIAPDGNRRYANKHNISFKEAYVAATKMLVEKCCYAFKNYPIGEITLYVMDNVNIFKRNPLQYSALVDAGVECFSLFRNEVRLKDVNIKFIGNPGLIHVMRPDSKNIIKDYVDDSNFKTINMLVGYSPDLELQKAVGNCIMNGKEISFENVEKYWSFNPVDLIVRTGGANRLSDYFPGCLFSEFYCTDTYAPEFSTNEFQEILDRHFSFIDTFDKVEKVENANSQMRNQI